MNIWKSLLAVCLLTAMFGCGAGASKKANQEGAAKQLPRLCVTGTQLMNEQGDTVVLKGVSYGWHQFWPRFYNASTVAYLSGDWGRRCFELLWEWTWIVPAMCTSRSLALSVSRQ